MSNFNRRGFIMLGAAALLFKTFKVSAADAPATVSVANLPLVDPNDMLASQLKYVEDFKKAPLAQGKKKCLNCALYVVSKDKKNGKAAGACQLFAGKAVYADAYCNSWNEKKA